MTVTLETKAAPAAPAGTARAKVTSYDELQSDGDVVMPGSLENEWAMVSRSSHSAYMGREPLVGYAALSEEPDGLYADVTYLEAGACELARSTSWSVGYVVTSSREPTPAERAKFGEGLRRVIEGWQILEVSPVEAPASPGTRSDEVCCDGLCTVGGKSCCAECATREAALKELIRFEYLRWQRSEFDRKQREREAEERAKATRPVVDGNLAILERHELRPSQVNSETRLAAVEAVARASKILGGPSPAIRWYAEEAIDQVEAIGVHFRGEGAVWIAARADAASVHEVAIHETWHCLKDSADEAAAARFATGLTLLRGVELHVGPRKSFEDRLEWVKVECFVPYLAPRSPKLQNVPGLRAGGLVVDDGVVYERTEDDTWRRVADLVPR